MVDEQEIGNAFEYKKTIVFCDTNIKRILLPHKKNAKKFITEYQYIAVYSEFILVHKNTLFRNTKKRSIVCSETIIF